MSVVPQSWLIGNTRCLWPDHGIAVTRAVASLQSPSSQWKKYACVVKRKDSKCVYASSIILLLILMIFLILYILVPSFSKARRYEELYTLQSEVESSEELKRRRRTSPVRFIQEPQTVGFSNTCCAIFIFLFFRFHTFALYCNIS